MQSTTGSGGSTLTADFVDFEVVRALEWLLQASGGSDRPGGAVSGSSGSNEAKRYAACCVIKELTLATPTLLYAYVPQLLEQALWAALRDSRQLIREQAAEVLAATLTIIRDRDSQQKSTWYSRIYEEAVKGFTAGKNNIGTPEGIHGSLLTMQLLLTQADGRYMDKHYQECYELVMRQRESRDQLVRKNVMVCLLLLASLKPNYFVETLLAGTMQYLQSHLRKDKDRSQALVAIGRIALAVQSSIMPYVESIVAAIKEALSLKQRNKLQVENAPIFQCIGMLALAVGTAIQKEVADMLDLMFACGLSEAMAQALTDIASRIPALLPLIQTQLLNLIAIQLSGSPFRSAAEPVPKLSAQGVQVRDVQFAENKDVDTFILAFSVLSSFDFSSQSLIHFSKQVVLAYLDDDVAAIRRAAALCCGQLLIKDPVEQSKNSNTQRMVASVLKKLLNVAVCDPEADNRLAVLQLLQDSRFDMHLAQQESIRTLFMALNDEQFDIRVVAIEVVGRLTTYNPAYILPSLRKTLIRLLTELEYSNVNRMREESAKLLGLLVCASQRLIKPYVDPILRVLVTKLKDASPGVASHIMLAVGELAAVGREDMKAYIPELMPIILETLQDQTSSAKRESALHTLGQLSTNAVYVIDPYWQYPTLLPVLLNMLKTEQLYSLRRETLKVMGILGALDPYRHKMNQSDLDEPVSADDSKMSELEVALIAGPSQNDDYFLLVAINQLVKVLTDSSLSVHHTAVVQAVMYIFKSLGTKCVPFLPQIMPALLQIMRNSSTGMLEFYFQQLSSLVVVVRQHVRNYLIEIFDMVKVYWDQSQNIQLTILSLVESIAAALDTEFRIYLPNMLGHLLQCLEFDKSEHRQVSMKVLHTFNVLGVSVQDYLSLIIPVIVGLMERQDIHIPFRKSCIQTLSNLARKSNFSDFASRVVHPLLRILESNQPELKPLAMDALCSLVHQLKQSFVVYIPVIYKIMKAHKLSHPSYALLISKLLRNEPLPQEMSREGGGDDYGVALLQEDPAADGTIKKLPVNQNHLKKAWETSQRSTKEDWSDWIRKLSIELLKESPSHALRACASLASSYQALARELFNASFMSVWTELYDQFQDELVHALEVALLSPTVPPEVVQVLLNLAEFMEHDDKPLPIDQKTLGSYAAKFHAYAKALHYKEAEFMAEPLPDTVEALISINNQLQQPDGAVGILKYAQQRYKIELKESWYEKLQRWDDALVSYDQRQQEEPNNVAVTLGRMRCLHALGEWEQLSQLAQERWFGTDDDTRKTIAPLGAAAAWGLGQWELMDDYIAVMKTESPDSVFLRSILNIHRNKFDEAQLCIEKTREMLDTELKALVGESYARAYNVVVRVQVLSELEEILTYKKFEDIPERQEVIKKTWERRLQGCQRNLDVWQRVLRVRSLVLSPKEDTTMWIKYANLSRKNGRVTQASRIFTQMLGANQDNPGDVTGNSPKIAYNYLKHIWNTEKSSTTLVQLKTFTASLATTLEASKRSVNFKDDAVFRQNVESDTHLLARCFLKLADWQNQLEEHWDVKTIPEILRNYEQATNYDKNWYKAWHSYALANFEVTSLYERMGKDKTVKPETFAHVVMAVKGFFRSISLSQGNSLQDTLRLLTLWFKYGYQADVYKAVSDGFSTVAIDTWLQVIPQLIARIHAPNEQVRRLNHQLLADVGKEHPQALVYSLTVASKSQSAARKQSALAIMDKLQVHSSKLIDQAVLVSQELIRVSILWHEIWHEGLEEASRLYFGEHNVKGMLEVLEPLHQMMEKGAETLREVSFIQSFGRDLAEAAEWCRKHQVSNVENDLHQAWDLYYQVFRKINKQLPQLTTLELQYVSPKLLAAEDLELAVPGTYRSSEPIVRIGSFVSTLTVITSKQRPRKLSIKGSDGRLYQYLLKGHEDLRQDERVMQLFQLVNTTLASDPETFKRHLSIHRYPVIPLSPNSGLIGWVPNCDTLHSMIRDYRETRKVLLNIEHRLMLQMAPDYDNLTLMQKVEVFQHALSQTTGQDLYKVMWLKSKNSEAWLDRRTNYSRSLAVVSMVGYILGLGDRHPSNLMIDRNTGKVILIDFGDCFEVAMHREKFPEKVPFRLTRMLVNAMEVSGIEGTYRITSENVMRVLRDNKESMMAVLTAFVHDPLINWKLFGEASGGNHNATTSANSQQLDNGATDDDFVDTTSSASKLSRMKIGSMANKKVDESFQQSSVRSNDDQQPEVLNAKAVDVINRVQNKLTGRDFKLPPGASALPVEVQVEKLIQQATAAENLCQCYVGWCAFW